MDDKFIIPTSLKLTRMFLFLSYFVVNIPGFSGFHMPFIGKKPEFMPLHAVVFLILLILEVIEQFFPILPRLKSAYGLIPRLFIIIISISFVPAEKYIFVYIPLGIYYITMKASSMISLSSLFLILLYSYFTWHSLPMEDIMVPDEIKGYIKNFVFIFRSSKVIFFFVMGFLWRKQVKEIEEKYALFLSLNESNRTIKNYADRVAASMVIEERNSMAQEIHDNLGHYLTAIQIQLSKALAFFHKDHTVSYKAVEDAKQVANDAMNDIRLSVNTLKDQSPFNFEESVEKLLERVRSSDIDVEIVEDYIPESIRYVLKVSYFRVLQEVLTNVMKHSGATKVHIRVWKEDGNLCLRVEDNGRGFNRNSLTDGHGLKGIERRLEQLQGSIEISSDNENGTIVAVKAPELY